MMSWFTRIYKLNVDFPDCNAVPIDRNKFPFNSILSGTSVTNKHSEESNQDAVAIVRNRFQNLNAVIVADGIGGLANGGDAARIAVSVAKDLLSSDRPIDINEVFANVQLSLHHIVKSRADNIELDQFGTTLLIATETKESFKVGYLGNGSIYHIRGNFENCLNESRPTPTCAVNLLNPQSIQKDGKETLTGFISPILLCEPSIIEIFKDKVNGDILIVTTDGLGSNDQIQLGKDGSGIWWSRTEMWLPELLKKIKFAIQNDSKPGTLKNFLNEMKANKKLDDDTTLGLIITNKAVSILKSQNGEDHVKS